MKSTEILLQGEGIPDIQFVKLGRDKCASDLLAVAAEHRKADFEGEFHVFAEDADEPLALDSPLPASEHGEPLRLHVNRCRSVEVAVTFNGETKEHRFGPGKTVGSVKKWAAIKTFGMTPEDAAEHVLQLAGTTDRPEPDAHIGSLVTNPHCGLQFDLVPLKRVEG